MERTTAVELRQVEGQLQMYLLTGLINSLPLESNPDNGIQIKNPLEVLPLLKSATERFQWVERNDFEVMWENAKGERGKAFADVALIDFATDDYDAKLVAEVIVGRKSEVCNSRIGSTHWFNTIVSEHSRIGEFMSNNETTDPNLIQSWGKRLYDSSKELLKWAERSKKLTND